MATAELDTTYSHDVAVAAITRFYNFAARIFGRWVGFEHPPEGGWPQITPDLAEHMGLSPEALQLIRHIPQFTDNEPCIMHGCRPRNFIAVCQHYGKTIDQTGKSPGKLYGEDDDDLDRGYPPHIFELASCGGYRYETNILIDTTRGVAVWHNNDGRPVGKGAPEPDATPEDEDEPTWTFQSWKSAPTFRIETFFAMAEEQLTLLNWLPALDTSAFNLEKLEVYGQPNEEQQQRMRIMRDAGWPGEDYDAERAIEASHDWAEARREMEQAQKEMDKLDPVDSD